MAKEEEEFTVGGLFGRCRVAGVWYWWVLWGSPWNTLYRSDHWQPEDVFFDEAPGGSRVYTALWEAFELAFPRAWGNVWLLDPTLRAHQAFPFSFYGVLPEPLSFPVGVRRPNPFPLLTRELSSDDDDGSPNNNSD